MNDLFRRLDKIINETKPPEKNFAEDEENMDDFTKLKRQIQHSLHGIRKNIEERKALFGKEQATASAEIRTLLKQTKSDAIELKNIVQKEKKKLSKKKEPKEEKVTLLAEREEAVELVHKHIKECERLDKKIIHGEDAMLMDDDDDQQSATVSALPDLGHLGEQGLRIMEKDQELNLILDDIGKEVQTAKQQALAMQKEAELQGKMIDHIEDEVIKANDTLENLNTRLKSTLDKARPTSSFCLDFILIVILLGIVGVIYSLFTN